MEPSGVKDFCYSIASSRCTLHNASEGLCPDVDTTCWLDDSGGAEVEETCVEGEEECLSCRDCTEVRDAGFLHSGRIRISPTGSG